MQLRKPPSRSLGNGGCDFVADPDLRADGAQIVWLPHINPATVIVAPAPDEFADARPIGELTPAFSRQTASGQHWLFGRGGDALPVAFVNGADPGRPAAVVIPLDDAFAMRIDAARHLWNAMTGHARGRAPGALTAQQRRKLGLMLRGLDGRLARCSYRVIAEVLFGPSSVPAGADWRTHDVRGRTIRLCDRGHTLMHGGYLDLLRYPRRFRV